LRHDADDDVEGFEGVSAGDLDPSHEQECSAPAVKLADALKQSCPALDGRPRRVRQRYPDLDAEPSRRPF